jgi:hypothetical protein
MTEDEWLRCTNPHRMLAHLPATPYERKLRLLACACCRRFLWKDIGDQRVRAAVEASERCADGLATKAQMFAARRVAEWCRAPGGATRPELAAQFAAWGRPREGLRYLLIAGLGAGNTYNAWTGTDLSPRRGSHAIAVCGLLRDIIGNPFRPVTFDPSWRTPEALALARAVYDERRFEDLPVLADALEEAGCADRDILGHCRGKGEHARGCWVVDLVLDKG